MKQTIAHTLFLILMVGHSYAQDSIPILGNQQEENLLSFQEHFFEALAQKSILKYTVAIQHLEKCNALKPNSLPVLFEFSKNYSLLNRPIEAISFAKKALELDPNNRWILEHLLTIYLQEKNSAAAIPILEKMAQADPNKNEQLILLYFESNQASKGKELLLRLEKQQLLTPNLKKLINFSKGAQNLPKTNPRNEATLSQLLELFSGSQDFESLKKILILSEKEDAQLFLEYAKKGLTLFPAQAFVYLSYGKGLNSNKQFKEALEILQNGIDFVIDDGSLEADFYMEMSLSYEGLGNKKMALEMKNKALALRRIK